MVKSLSAIKNIKPSSCCLLCSVHKIHPEPGPQTGREDILYWHQSQPVSSHSCGGCQESFIQTGIFLSPLISLGCVFINYRSKMSLDPRERFKGEIHEVLLVAYLHLSHKEKLTPWQVVVVWVVAEQRYMSHARLFLWASLCSPGAERTGMLPELPLFLS